MSFLHALALVLLAFIPATRAKLPPDADNSTRALNTTASLEFDLFLTPKSPLLWFTEARDVPGTDTWRSEDDKTDWAVLEDGAPVTANSMPGRVSYRLGPAPSTLSKLYLPMVGRGVRINGNVSSDYTSWATYHGRDGEVVMDGKSSALYEDDYPFTRRGLLFNRHSNSTSAPGVIDITSATVRTGMNTSAASLVEVPTSFAPFVLDGKPNPVFQYTGTWAVDQLPDNTPHLEGTSDSTVRINVPTGTAFLVVNGTAGPRYGSLAVVWRDPMPELRLELSDEVRGTYSRRFPASNASRPFIAPREPLYYVALDATKSYSFTLSPRNVDDVPRVALHSVTFYSGSNDAQEPFSVKSPSEFPGFIEGESRVAGQEDIQEGGGVGAGNAGGVNDGKGSGGGQESKPPVGAIVGGVVGGVVVLLLLGGLVWWRWRRRRKTRAQQKLFDVDPDPPSMHDELPLSPLAPASSQSRRPGYENWDEDSYIQQRSILSGTALPLSPAADVPYPWGYNPASAPHAPNEPPGLSGAALEDAHCPREDSSNLPGPIPPHDQGRSGRASAPRRAPRRRKFDYGPPLPTPAPLTHEVDAGKLLPPLYNPAWREDGAN